MPESRFVRASRLRPLVTYLAVAVVGLLLVDALMDRFEGSQALRILVVLGWLVLLPMGGWWVWRRG